MAWSRAQPHLIHRLPLAGAWQHDLNGDLSGMQLPNDSQHFVRARGILQCEIDLNLQARRACDPSVVVHGLKFHA